MLKQNIKILNEFFIKMSLLNICLASVSYKVSPLLTFNLKLLKIIIKDKIQLSMKHCIRLVVECFIKEALGAYL